MLKHGAEGLDDYLSEQLETDHLLLAMYIGTDRAVSKPVLQVLTAKGRLLGFAKVGSNTVTAPLVHGEAATLLHLADRELSSLRVPRVLHAAKWSGNEILVQEALVVDSYGDPSPSELLLATREVSLLAGRRAGKVASSTYLCRLRERMETVPEDWRPLMLDALDEVVRSAGDTTVAFGAWHGDWTPWNMAPAGSRLSVWDWEHFDSDVPIGFDAIHHSIATNLVIGGQPPVDAVSFVSTTVHERLREMEVEPGSVDLVMTLYLLEIGTRYLRDGEHEAGTRLGRSIHEWLIPAVQAALSRHQNRSQ
ncbi:hypothetical protein ASG90_13040 [Nocardioides sp. Soil797]|nr:hypothetical protein ASG90_13040 [Nocardioides sp. Soil797]